MSIRRRRCSGKRSYPTLSQAQAAAAALARSRERNGNTIVTYLRAYGCACGSFHFGSTRQIDWTKVK